MCSSLQKQGGFPPLQKLRIGVKYSNIICTVKTEKQTEKGKMESIGKFYAEMVLGPQIKVQTGLFTCYPQQRPAKIFLSNSPFFNKFIQCQYSPECVMAVTAHCACVKPIPRGFHNEENIVPLLRSELVVQILSWGFPFETRPLLKYTEKRN